MNAIERQKRNETLFFALEDGYKPRELAKMFRLDINSVYRILNNAKEKYIDEQKWDDDNLDWRDLSRLVWVTKFRCLSLLGWTHRQIADLCGYSQSHVSRCLKYSKDWGYGNCGLRLRVFGGVYNEGAELTPRDYVCQPANDEYCWLRPVEGGRTVTIKYDRLVGKHTVLSSFARDYDNVPTSG